MSDMAIKYQHRPISVDDYHRMAEAGIFAEDERVELLDGELIVMPPMGTPHSGRVYAVSRMLSLRLGDRAGIWAQLPIILDKRSEPEPDVAVVALDEADYGERKPTPADVHWLIEISDSSRWVDFHKKGPLYARAGIAEFWIVDVVERRLIVHRGPSTNGYMDVSILQPDDQIAPLAFTNETFVVRDFTG